MSHKRYFAATLEEAKELRDSLRGDWQIRRRHTHDDYVVEPLERENPSRQALWDSLAALPDAEAAKNAVAELTDEEVLDFWSWNDREAAMHIAAARRGEHDDSLDEIAESLRESLLREVLAEVEDRVRRPRKNPRRNPDEVTHRGWRIEKAAVTQVGYRTGGREGGISRPGKGRKIAGWVVHYPDGGEKWCDSLKEAKAYIDEYLGDDVEPLERENPSRRNPEEHKIYVANLAAYNAGRMKGKWIEPSSDEGELVDQIVEAIGGNADDEYAIHDYDNFPNMGENPSLEDVAAMAELLEEHPIAIIKAAQGFAGDDMDDLKSWLDEGYGIYESEKDYVEQFVDDMGGPSELGKDTINTYFDYESFGHDLSIDADEEDRERYEGMSDQEIGEEAIDDFYGDKIPKDLADRYFDYDSYARDVFMEVASARVPGEGLVVFNKR